MRPSKDPHGSYNVTGTDSPGDVVVPGGVISFMCNPGYRYSESPVIHYGHILSYTRVVKTVVLP